jgi:hypothetical protein
MDALVLTRHDLQCLSLDHVFNVALGASGLWFSTLMAVLVVTSSSLFITSTSAMMQLKWELPLSSPFFRGSGRAAAQLQVTWRHTVQQLGGEVAEQAVQVECCQVQETAITCSFSWSAKAEGRYC